MLILLLFDVDFIVVWCWFYCYFSCLFCCYVSCWFYCYVSCLFCCYVCCCTLHMLSAVIYYVFLLRFTLFCIFFSIFISDLPWWSYIAVWNIRAKLAEANKRLGREQTHHHSTVKRCPPPCKSTSSLTANVHPPQLAGRSKKDRVKMSVIGHDRYLFRVLFLSHYRPVDIR